MSPGDQLITLHAVCAADSGHCGVVSLCEFGERIAEDRDVSQRSDPGSYPVMRTYVGHEPSRGLLRNRIEETQMQMRRVPRAVPNESALGAITLEQTVYPLDIVLYRGCIFFNRLL